RSDLESMFRPYTDEERAVLLDKLRYMYGRFVGAVAEGRKLTKDQVDAVGRGHVYTGALAQPIQLVDRFGGIGDAIDEAKKRMGLSLDTKVQIYELPKATGGMLEQLKGLFGGGAQATPHLQITDLPVVRDLLRGLPASVLVSPDAPQARLPYQITFE